jgi:hypothetical protein
MPLCVRLDEQTERALAEAAAAAGLTKSDLVRKCVAEFLAGQAPAARAWEAGRKLFGKYGSGRGDLSKRRRELVREKVHAKARRR